ncbi:isoprenylcysteine carboxylmethyltransferase family protein [Candidatus Bathyarchaeota archaeon]|nr:isoprenylcysteine carboxylmethyltransferase family protein [Candidatus Bathyarchaeota archaeon]
MLVEFIVATVLLVCLVCFFLVNLHNILVVHKRRSHAKVSAEVEHPSGFIVNIAGFGTFVYFFEALVYLFLVFSGLIFLLYDAPLFFGLLLVPYTQVLGLMSTIIGYFLFIWSVIARGQYATSWGMPENQKLVTWGPYKYVRHPSYLGYFLMFFGLLLIWSNLFTLIPLSAIPGYLRVVVKEEKLLVQRFGDEYLDYQKKTGRFIPRF